MSPAAFRVLLASADLMLRARIEGAVRRHGGELLTASDQAALLAALPAAAGSAAPRLAILDVGLPGLQLDAAVAALRTGLSVGGAVAACGPHVHRQLLEAARVAGCDPVLTRGQIDRDIDALVARSCPH
jgi:CheY-like chemotaxis protein